MNVPKIYMDNCCYNRPFDNQEQIKIHLETEAKLYIQSGIRDGRYILVWSYMLDYENNENPYDEKRNAIAAWRNIAQEYCPSSDDVLSKGQTIIKLGVKPKDALHIACAIKSGCNYFLTTDKGLMSKNISEIKIINPIDFVTEVED